MGWIIGIIVVIGVIASLAQSDDLLSKIMVFAGFLIIVGLITSWFFSFMSVVSYISGVVLIGALVIKVFQKIFMK